MSYISRASLSLALFLCCFALPAAAAPPASQPLMPAGPAPIAAKSARVRTPAGSQPSGEAVIKNDLDELRQFEENAFPRPSLDETRAEADTVVSPPHGRPTADSPPSGVHSDEHGKRSGEHQANMAPEPWLTKLARPDLPIRWDPKLVRYLEFYKNNPRGRAIMSTWLRRVGRYGKLISQALHRHQMPQSLIYLAMIESGFDPKTTSHAGATGIWQFMVSPGHSYGLARDHWVDERRNPEKATEAALRYLKDLYRRFGSWELAMAAYNAGHGGLVLAMRKYNTNDYWQLCKYEAGLPWDTVLYVPKVLAAAVVGANRGAFGFDQIGADPELPFAQVSVPTSITMAQAAAAAGVSKDVIEQLNPELLRGRTPPGKSWLRVPREAEQRFYAGLAAIKGQLARYMPYVVRLGDSMEEVARAHGISTAGLRTVNGFEHSSDLRPGLTILVPARSTTRQATSEADPPSGDPVLVPLPSDRPKALPGRRRVFYRTVMNDNLDEVASYLGVSREELASWNALDPHARLVSGMVLQAFVAQSFDASKVVLLDSRRVRVMTAGSEEFYETYEEQRGRKRIVYLVRDGDTLGGIGRRYGLTVGDLMRINQLGRKAKLKAGQKLVLYVDNKRLAPRRRPVKAVSGDDDTVAAESDSKPKQADADADTDNTSDDSGAAASSDESAEDQSPTEAAAGR